MSMDTLIEKIIKTQNPSVVGLDPKLEFIPEHIKAKAFAEHGKNLKGAASAFLQFNKEIINSIYDIVPAIKPQCAYYEAMGHEGVVALYATIEYAKQKGMYVITDGKRNDIGSTMEAYADAHIGLTLVEDERYSAFGSDCLTVNAYLGTDGIAPLTKVCKELNKSIFVLVKTSNPSSGEFQDRLIDGEALYVHMGRMCEKWGEGTAGKYGYTCVGAVVGATYPAQLAELRKELPHTMFLVPGYGAQGGGAKDVAAAFDKNGLGAIVNSSRAIMTAWKKQGIDPKDHGSAARQAAIEMRDDISSLLGKIGK